MQPLPSDPEPSRRLVPLEPPGRPPSYAHLIASCRRAAGLSRAELGERIGVPAATIGLWEDPTYEGIDLPILERVASAAGRRLSISFTPVRQPQVQGPRAWTAGLERTA